ncbi:hypothetical protein CONCODRAFT_70781 [Conidiobolus coronatus NRRL 28638]|uniref:F-box domain-containing protein n=1 Tax=Conidiobolus coronatus (strain ATCC 28846 / CBS 209.66 / NRRL 28638) TaxID=796925 RepID=A0A137P5M7_CONC2|nr:hypothetical protein CONCODRAFT_70781 [Conidiobolus coronatus NRRL 28638]|eukprot:KXN70318.1 hypothetical protein CONCODRAFT_70781 [Conidiobolus coronatus NRRL 28638]
MKDADWILIFKLKEFIDYFSINDLIQLSLICKKFRNCLSSAIFSTFNFNNFTNMRSYKTCVISDIENRYGSRVIHLHNAHSPLNSEMIDNIGKFNLDIKLYPIQSKKLEICYAEHYFYLLQAIPSLFTRLTTVAISNSKIKFETLQYLLDSIACLDNVELSNNKLTHNSLRSTAVYIKWPNSLKSLKICSNMISRIEDVNNSISPLTTIFRLTPTDYPLLYLKCLSKLKYFEYKHICLQPEYKNLCEFLKLNPQITSLKMTVTAFHPKLLTAVEHVNSLYNLHLSYERDQMSEVEYSHLSTLNTSGFVTITIHDFCKNYDKIIKKFPSLAGLLVEMDCSSIEKLFTLIKKLPSANNLHLKINLEHSNALKLTFPKLNNLNSLEFILNSTTSIKNISWNVDSCPNLKLVKFSKAKDQFYTSRPKINRKLTGCWKIIYFPNSVAYYKVI